MPSPDPVPSSPPVRPRQVGSRADRIVTLAAWIAGLGLIVGLAALVAGLVHLAQQQSTRFEIRPVEVVEETETVQMTLPPSEATRTESGGLVVSPRWISPPRPQFPALARKMGVDEGQVRLECVVGVDGRVEDCVVLEETPAGAGFAEAAIEAAKAARLSPRTFNGEATRGKVRFPTRFSLG